MQYWKKRQYGGKDVIWPPGRALPLAYFPNLGEDWKNMQDGKKRQDGGKEVDGEKEVTLIDFTSILILVIFIIFMIN